MPKQIRMTAKEYRDKALKKVLSKYRNRQTIVDGIKFASQLEANHYCENKMAVKSGILKYFLRQVPIFLPGGVKMVIDFLEVFSNGEIKFVDTKGYATRDWLNKKKIAEAIYPFKIEVVK